MGSKPRLSRLDRILRNGVIYGRSRRRTCIRLEKGSPRLERKIKRGLFLLFIALSASFLYSFLNFLLVLKPFVFANDHYAKLQQSSSAESLTLLSIPEVSSNEQLPVIENLIKQYAPSIVAAVDVSPDSKILEVLKYSFSSVVESPGDPGSSKVIVASNKKITSSHGLGVDIPPGLVVEFETPRIKLAVCSPLKVVSKETSSEAKMALRRIATAMRHSPDNWIVNCRIGGSIFSPAYQKFLEAMKGAEDIQRDLSFDEIVRLTWNARSEKARRPLFLFSKGNIAGTLLERIPFANANQDIFFSSFFTSFQTLSSSSNE